MKIQRLLIIFSCLLLLACSDKWDGFVYPNKNDLTTHVGIGAFKSLEECRDSARAVISKTSSVERGDYECGLNCKFNGGLNICEETAK
jgi:hypothetical protein